ncbi:MAG TPA: hypothetical protein VMM38_10725 [Aridibacter sp.]|nr:hypothetical protein [Aridibacter sp.]
MKNVVIGSALILALAAASAGQDQKLKKDPNSVEEERPRTAAGEVMEPDGSLVKAGTNLEAKLLSTLDVRKANVGDEVVLKTTKTLKQDGEVIVPKGTKLIGRVTEVTTESAGNGVSRLGIVFDRLENEEISAPFSASIVTIANAGSRLTAGDVVANETGGSAGSHTSVSKGSSGGGLLGGATGTVGGLLNTTTSTVGGVTNTVGSAGGSVLRTVNGIRISQSSGASADGSTTLSAEGKNLRLNKGTRFMLQTDQSVSN